MNVRHEFEEDDTGDELTLNPDLTYEVVQTFVDIDPEGQHSQDIVFTHRVKLGRYQFEVLPGEDRDLGRIYVIDTEPDEIPGLGDDAEGDDD